MYKFTLFAHISGDSSSGFAASHGSPHSHRKVTRSNLLTSQLYRVMTAEEEEEEGRGSAQHQGENQGLKQHDPLCA